MSKIKVSIIIVFYRNKKELLGCLNSIKENKPKTSYEIIVVDNSENSISLKLRGVQYIKSPKNLGYGAGNNLGADIAKGKYLFILNPDTKILPNALDTLVNFLDKNKKAAIVAPNLLDKKGKVFPQLGSRELTPLRGIFAFSIINKLFPNNPISKQYWLKDMPMNKLREADAVPGSAFLIRKEAFEKVGRFDENFFLFFEESDLGKRIRKLGYQIFINPKAEVIHHWHKNGLRKKAFEKSRFYYFKKHYGYFSALVVEIFARLSKWHAALILITLLGAFLRFYRIEENMVFHGELGHNYLAIKNLVQKSEIPLLGPPTSHPWLSFGPLFYWIFTPFLVLGGYNPIVGAYFMAFMGVLVIVLNFIVIKKVFEEKTAILSSYLIAISPVWIALTREARFFSLVTLCFYPFFYFLYKTLKENGKYLFWAGLFFGIMLNFHLTPIILIPVILTAIYIKRNKIKRKHLYKGFLGMLIPNIPFLLYNLKTGFNMLTRFTLWIPYRIAGFIGLYPKNNMSTELLRSNLLSLYEFFGLSYLPSKNFAAVLLFFVVIAFIAFETKKKYTEKRKDIAWLLLFLSLVFGYLGILVHGDSPSHYYLPLLPLPILFLSLLLTKVWQKFGMKTVMIFLVFLTVINFSYFFSAKWFYKPQDRRTNLLVPYNLQLKVARSIIADSNWQEFSLSRVGPFDYFEGDYRQNYQYLLWWLGNEPREKVELHYIIYEGRENFPANYCDCRELFKSEDLLVLKGEK